MFEVLVGSGARRQVRASRGIAAAAVHAVVITGVVRATVRPPEPPARPRLDTTVFVLREPPPIAAGGVSASGVAAPTPFVAPRLTIVAPGEMPTGFPPVQLGEGVPRLSWGPPAGDPAGPGGETGPIAAPRTAAQVDEPATVIHQPEPRYPPVLRAAGREGRVLLEFVIDTSGHVEPASLRVVERTEAGFDAAALEAIGRSLFRPATLAGRPVRQRTLQAVAFRITP